MRLHVRQNNNLVRIFGESNAGNNGGKPQYVFLFLGQRNGSKVSGKVYALSKGRQTGVVNATFNVQADKRLTSNSNFDLGGTAWKRIYPDYRKQINEYVRDLEHRGDQVLEPVPSEDNDPRENGDQSVTNTTVQAGLQTCVVTPLKYGKNLSEQTLLQEIDLYPGALVQISESMKKGRPLIVTELPQEPLKYIITGLQGMDEEKNIFTLRNPKLSNYEEKLSSRPAWWLENRSGQYGVANNILPIVKNEWSRKQFMMDININYRSLSASAYTDFAYSTDRESDVVNAYLKQVFCNVKVETLDTPAEWFEPTTALAQVHTVGYVKNNDVAILGQKADFDDEKCTAAPNYVSFEMQGGYEASFIQRWTEPGNPLEQRKDYGTVRIGWYTRHEFPNGANNINVETKSRTRCNGPGG